MSKILVSGGLVPTTKDTLLDVRTRVATFSEIANIENPARFMVITVEDTGKKYEVRKLSSKIIGGIEVENSTIDINDPEALVDLGLAEELRSEDEKVRQSNESKRIEAENLRKSAEDSRKVNETNRVSAEGLRETSERTRVSSEDTRNANEQTRNSNETKRQSQESTRQNQESARQTNESTRKTNESERKTEETSRRTAELSRSSAENERVKNEQNRTTAENTRSSAEDRRVANEEQRTANETARSNAELSREQAEGNRASTFNTLKGQMQTTIQEGQTAVAATEKATSDAQKVVDNYDAKVAEQDGKLAELGSQLISKEVVLPRKKTDYLPKTDKSGGVIVSGYKRAEYVVREGDKILVEGKFNVPNDVCAVSFMSTDSASSIVSVVVSGSGEISKILDVPKNAAFLFLADNGAEDGLKAYTTKSKMEEIENIKDANILAKEQIKEVKGEETLCEITSVSPVRVNNTGANCYFIKIEGDVERNGETIVCVSESLKNDLIKIADCSEDGSSNGEDKYPQIKCDENGMFSFVPNINNFPLIRIHPTVNTNADAELAVCKNIKGLLGVNKEVQKFEKLKEDVGFCNVVIDSISENLELIQTSDYLPKTDKTGGVIVSGYKRGMYEVSEGEVIVINGSFNIPKGVCAVAFAKTTSSNDLVAVVSEGSGEDVSVSYDVVVPKDANFLFLAEKDNNFIAKKLSVSLDAKFDANKIMLLSKYSQNTLKCYGYMQQSMGDVLSLKIPRFNILCPDDFNDRINCWKEAVEWAISDAGNINSIQCIFSAGDFISAAVTTKESFDKIAKELFSYVTNIDIPALVCLGNHDIGHDGNYSAEEVPSLAEIKTMIIERMYNSLAEKFKPNCVIPSDEDACYYHYDNSERKVRLIALNDVDLPISFYTDENGTKHLMYSGSHNEGGLHANAKTQHNASYYSHNQLQWLVNTLQSTPSDYMIVTNNHIGLKDMSTGDLGGSHMAMIKILNAYKEKKSGSVSVTPVYKVGVNGITTEILVDGYTVTYDFTQTQTHPMLHHNGHAHNFEYYTSFEGNIPCIQTMCAYSVVGAAKFAKGLTETSCDIISVNQNTNKMYVLRYGYYPREPHEGTHLDMNGFNYVDEPINVL